MNEIWQMYAFIRIQYCCDFGQKKADSESIKKMEEKTKTKEKRKEWNFFTGGVKEIQEHACLRVRCTMHLFPIFIHAPKCTQ